MLIDCGECGNRISDRAKVCPQCGAPVTPPPKQVNCEECGNKVDVLAKMCPQCGAPVAQPRTSPPSIIDQRDVAVQGGVPVGHVGDGRMEAHGTYSRRAVSPVEMERTSAAPTTMKRPSDYGIALVIIPIVGLIWRLIAGPTLVGYAVPLLTAVIATMEASKAGMVSDRQKGTYSPTAWFFIIWLLWVIGYPAYLYKRRHYGFSDLLVVGIVLSAIYGTLSVLTFIVARGY